MDKTLLGLLMFEVEVRRQTASPAVTVEHAWARLVEDIDSVGRSLLQEVFIGGRIDWQRLSNALARYYWKESPDDTRS